MLTPLAVELLLLLVHLPKKVKTFSFVGFAYNFGDDDIIMAKDSTLNLPGCCCSAIVARMWPTIKHTVHSLAESLIGMAAATTTTSMSD